MSYWRLFYHLVWSTKDRLPLIEPEFEEQLHNMIVAKSKELGATVYAVGGVENHIHLAASIPPKIAVAEFVRKVKGSTSYFVTQDLKKDFKWQKEYGAISFSGKQLKWVVKYIKHQRQHHETGQLQDFMETWEGEELE